MKKIKKLKLDFLNKNSLKKSEMNNVTGGVYGDCNCICGCLEYLYTNVNAPSLFRDNMGVNRHYIYHDMI